MVVGIGAGTVAPIAKGKLGVGIAFETGVGIGFAVAIGKGVGIGSLIGRGWCMAEARPPLFGKISGRSGISGVIATDVLGPTEPNKSSSVSTFTIGEYRLPNPE